MPLNGQVHSVSNVLHVFQKKSKSGSATPKMDVDLIVKRYKEARERAKNE